MFPICSLLDGAILKIVKKDFFYLGELISESLNFKFAVPPDSVKQVLIYLNSSSDLFFTDDTKPMI